MIKSVPASTLRNHFADVVSELTRKKDYMLITKKNKPITVIVNIDFFEELLALSSPSYLKSIRQAREDYRKGRVMSHAEVFGALG